MFLVFSEQNYRYIKKKGKKIERLENKSRKGFRKALKLVNGIRRRAFLKKEKKEKRLHDFNPKGFKFPLNVSPPSK